MTDDQRAGSARHGCRRGPPRIAPPGMNRKTKKPVVLTRELVRVLTPAQLIAVAGGATGWCTKTTAP